MFVCSDFYRFLLLKWYCGWKNCCSYTNPVLPKSSRERAAMPMVFCNWAMYILQEPQCIASWQFQQSHRFFFSFFPSYATRTFCNSFARAGIRFHFITLQNKYMCLTRDAEKLKHRPMNRTLAEWIALWPERRRPQFTLLLHLMKLL